MTVRLGAPGTFLVDASSACFRLRFESPERPRALDTERAKDMKPPNVFFGSMGGFWASWGCYGEIHGLSRQVSLLNFEQGLAWVCLVQILPEFSDKVAILQSCTGIFIYIGYNQQLMVEEAGTTDYRALVATPKGLQAVTAWLMKLGLLSQFSLAAEQLYQ